MDITLWLKFLQHPDLMQELLATGDAELIEVRLDQHLFSQRLT
jgi:predicted NAD-dependent protein-ADP-ribosyltransferase YbiA (DUF1768 family)